MNVRLELLRNAHKKCFEDGIDCDIHFILQEIEELKADLEKERKIHEGSLMQDYHRLEKSYESLKLQLAEAQKEIATDDIHNGNDLVKIQDLQAQLYRMRSAILKWQELYPLIAQIFDGWHCDKAWTEFDAGVRAKMMIAGTYTEKALSQLGKEEVTDEEIVQKLESMKNEKTITTGSSEGAREHLKKLMEGKEEGKEHE